MGLLNVDGYYDPLLGLFDKALEEGFMKCSSQSIVVFTPTASEFLDKMEVFAHSHDLFKMCNRLFYLKRIP